MNEYQLAHIDGLKTLAQKCEELGLTLYKYEYDFAAFGSWTVVIGKPKFRHQFTWDGKESFISIGQAQIKNGGYPPAWQPIDEKTWKTAGSIGGTKTTAKEVFDYIIKMLDLLK